MTTERARVLDNSPTKSASCDSIAGEVLPSTMPDTLPPWRTRFSCAEDGLDSVKVLCIRTGMTSGARTPTPRTISTNIVD